MTWHELLDLILRTAFCWVQYPHPEQRRWNADLGSGPLRGKDRVLAGRLPSTSALWPRCGTATFLAQPTGFCGWCSFSRNALNGTGLDVETASPFRHQSQTPDWSKVRLGSETSSWVAAAYAKAHPVFLSFNVFRWDSSISSTVVLTTPFLFHVVHAWGHLCLAYWDLLSYNTWA